MIGAVLLFLVAVVEPGASAQTTGLRAAEGEWVGYISFRGAFLTTDQTFRGGFEFVSEGGELEGVFQWGGGVTQVGGVVSGPDTMPRFDLTSVVSNGVNIPDVTGGGEIMLTAATCERLEGTGDWAGVADISEIVWWAVRGEAASEPAAFFDAVEALQVRVGDLVASIESGAVIVGGGVIGQLEPLMAEAEMLAARLSRTGGCGIEFYRSVIASQIRRIVEYVLLAPDIDVFTLGQTLLLAVRAGLIGGDDWSPQIAGGAQLKVEERISAAIEDADVVELTILAAIAEDMGWDDLAADTRFALEEIGE